MSAIDDAVAAFQAARGKRARACKVEAEAERLLLEAQDASLLARRACDKALEILLEAIDAAATVTPATEPTP